MIMIGGQMVESQWKKNSDRETPWTPDQWFSLSHGQADKFIKSMAYY
jgi:hypothetical protein